jgi:dsDNA-specific endonuclease/ATPase MutS2
MSCPFAPGDLVQTPFGKGLVRELRNNGRVAVDVRGRSMIFDEREISPADDRRRRPRASDADARPQDGPAGPAGRSIRAAAEVDLHGLTVEQALSRASAALNDALLADRLELRFIHGRSSTRIRDALHRWLRGIASVRGFQVDPRNEGVTIVRF